MDLRKIKHENPHIYKVTHKNTGQNKKATQANF